MPNRYERLLVDDFLARTTRLDRPHSLAIRAGLLIGAKDGLKSEATRPNHNERQIGTMPDGLTGAVSEKYPRRVTTGAKTGQLGDSRNSPLTWAWLLAVVVLPPLSIIQNLVGVTP